MSKNQSPSKNNVLCDELWRNIYEYDYHMPPINKVSYDFIQKIRNDASIKIQMMYRRHGLGKHTTMPIMFMDDFDDGKVTKDKLIKIYMKFYPLDYLYALPKHLVRNNYNMNQIADTPELKEMFLKFSRPYESLKNSVTPFEVFKILHKFNMNQLVWY